jgi:hypothetical protein
MMVRNKVQPTFYSKNMPASIIFEDANSHISNKDQGDEMPLHHGMHMWSADCVS